MAACLGRFEFSISNLIDIRKILITLVPTCRRSVLDVSGPRPPPRSLALRGHPSSRSSPLPTQSSPLTTTGPAARWHHQLSLCLHLPPSSCFRLRRKGCRDLVPPVPGVIRPESAGPLQTQPNRYCVYDPSCETSISRFRSYLPQFFRLRCIGFGIAPILRPELAGPPQGFSPYQDPGFVVIENCGCLPPSADARPYSKKLFTLTLIQPSRVPAFLFRSAHRVRRL